MYVGIFLRIRGKVMGRYILKRVLQMIPILLLLTFCTFTLMSLAPGDPAEAKLKAQGIIPSPEALEQTREEMGLKDPFLVRYGKWLFNAVRGDLGISYKKGTSVRDDMIRATGKTALLALSALLFSLTVSLPLGIAAAVFQNSVVDYIVRFLSFLWNAIPRFLAAILLMYLFCIRFKMFSVIGQGRLRDLVLPVLAMSLGLISSFSRHIRSETLEQMGKSYVAGAMARGDEKWRILFKNILHNSLLTLLTIAGLTTAGMLGGSVVIETIFGWPGLGKMAMDAITNRDYPVILAFTVWMCMIYMIINLLTDLAYRKVDPRVNDQDEENR